NGERIQAKRGLSLDEVRIQAADTHRELIEEISHVGDEAWSAKAFYETERRTTLGNLLGSVTGAAKRPFGHAFAHLPDLDAYVSSLADCPMQRVAVATDRSETAQRAEEWAAAMADGYGAEQLLIQVLLPQNDPESEAGQAEA